MAYAAKYASGLYGPFRDAVGVEIVEAATARDTNRTTGTGVKPFVKHVPTSNRAPTSSWSSPRCRTSTS